MNQKLDFSNFMKDQCLEIFYFLHDITARLKIVQGFLSGFWANRTKLDEKWRFLQFSGMLYFSLSFSSVNTKINNSAVHPFENCDYFFPQKLLFRSMSEISCNNLS